LLNWRCVEISYLYLLIYFVAQDNFGFDLAAVEAAAKKHEAIETDIFAYEERVQAVVAVSQELEAENYHDIDRINAR
jgi:spectrin beta